MIYGTLRSAKRNYSFFRGQGSEPGSVIKSDSVLLSFPTLW